MKRKSNSFKAYYILNNYKEKILLISLLTTPIIKNPYRSKAFRLLSFLNKKNRGLAPSAVQLLV